jgi:urea transporter
MISGIKIMVGLAILSAIAAIFLINSMQKKPK